MAGIYHIFVVLLVASLSLPPAPFSPCLCTGCGESLACCTPDKETNVNEQANSCCSGEGKQGSVLKESCCNSAKSCTLTCTCCQAAKTRVPLNRVTPSVNQVSPTAISYVDWDIEADAIPAIDALTVYRPPIDHNSRQASLCTWRK
jgi:hypothetical protein